MKHTPWLALYFLVFWSPACGPSPREEMQPAPWDQGPPCARVARPRLEDGAYAPWVADAYLTQRLKTPWPNTVGDLNQVVDANRIARFEPNSDDATPVPLAGLSPAAATSFPLFGRAAGVLGRGGLDQSGTRIVTRHTVTEMDRDAHDLKAHVRLAVAPVMQGASHTVEDAPYGWVQLDNLTRGTTLGHVFLSAADSNTPWQADALYPTNQSTPWQTLDFALAPRDVTLGDTLQLAVHAAGCAVGGHFGSLYVDGLGPTLPGLQWSAQGPTLSNDDAPLSYALALANHGLLALHNVVLNIPLPVNTTLTSLDAPGLQCTSPEPGLSGAVHCTAAVLPPEAHVPLSLRVQVNPGAAGQLVLANATVQADEHQVMLAPRVVTQLTHGSHYADLAVTMAPMSPAPAMRQQAFNVVCTNFGPDALERALLFDALPAQLVARSWRCTARGVASCNGADAAGGVGALQAELALAPGAQVLCQIIADVQPSAAGQAAYSAWVDVSGASVADPQTHNNSATLLFDSRWKSGDGAGAGTACDDKTACATGHCVDGVCCESACQGPCLTCSAPGNAGSCMPVWGDPPPGRAGCAPFACPKDGVCPTQCTSDADCISNTTCARGLCVRPRVTGPQSLCRRDIDCAPGSFCTPRGTCESPSMQTEGDARWLISGTGAAGYGCSAAGTSSGHVMWAVAVLLVRRVRRAARKPWWPAVVAIASAQALWVKPSVAQVVQRDLPANRFAPYYGANDVLDVRAATIQPALLALHGGLSLQHSQDLVRVSATNDRRVGRSLVQHQEALELFGALSVRGRYELGAALPLLVQGGHSAAYLDEALEASKWGTYLGDLRIVQRANVHHGSRLDLALGTQVTVPTGTAQQFVSWGRVTITPELEATLALGHGARVLLQAGHAFRPRRRLLNVDTHHALTYGAGGEVVFAWGRHQFAPQMTVVGEWGLARRRNANPVGLHAGVSWRPSPALQFTVGVGTGLTGDYGTARWRVLFTVASKRTLVARAQPVRARALAAPPTRAEGGAAPTRLPLSPAPLAAPADAPLALPDAYREAQQLRDARPVPAKAVRFKRGSSALSAHDRAALDVMHAWLNRVPIVQGLRIVGHTDATGSARGNERLSLRRALAARAYLIGRGVNSVRLQAVGRGARDPLTHPGDVRGQAQNRRLTFEPL